MNTLLLEIAVVALGIALLLLDAFSDRSDKNFLSYLGALGLGGVLLLSFVHQNSPDPESPSAAFVTADVLSVFFIRFLLVATIIVVLMAPSFLPVLERYVPAERKGGGCR